MNTHWKDCHLKQTANLLEKSLMLGKIEVRRGRGYQRMRRLDGMNVGKLWEMVRDREAWRAAVLGVTKNWTWQGNWTTTAFLEILWPGVKNFQKLNENQKKEDGVTCSAQVVSLSLSFNVGFCPSCLGRCSIKLQSRRYMLQVEILIGCWFWHMLWHSNSEDVSPKVCRNSLPAEANHLTC